MANEPEFSNMASEMGNSDRKTESNGHMTGMGAEEMLQALRRLKIENTRILHNQEWKNQVNNQVLQNLI